MLCSQLQKLILPLLAALIIGCSSKQGMGDAPRLALIRQQDINHVVRSEKEQLPVIPKWYTGDEANAERLARINDLTSLDTLVPGQRVFVPRYMLVRKEILPAPTK